MSNKPAAGRIIEPNWRKAVYQDAQIKFTFRERVKILFGCNLAIGFRFKTAHSPGHGQGEMAHKVLRKLPKIEPQ